MTEISGTGKIIEENSFENVEFVLNEFPPYSPFWFDFTHRFSRNM